MLARLLGFMLSNRGGIAPILALFYPRNVCVFTVALCAFCIGLAIVIIHNYHAEYPSGNTPEWQSAIGLFVTNAANLMKAIKDTLRASKLAQAIPNNFLVSLPHPSKSGANREEQSELHSYAWWYSGLILIFI